jgi:hypothetical protein
LQLKSEKPLHVPKITLFSKFTVHAGKCPN